MYEIHAKILKNQWNTTQPKHETDMRNPKG